MPVIDLHGSSLGSSIGGCPASRLMTGVLAWTRSALVSGSSIGNTGRSSAVLSLFVL